MPAALSPDDPISSAAVGVAARAHGNLEEAIEAFERALRIDPAMELASAQLAEIRGSKPEL